MTTYDAVADFVSKIKNARFGEMVRHVEKILDEGAWRDYTIPAGVRYQFGSHEFDYFLVVQEIDAELVRMAYTRAKDVQNLAVKEMRLADLTGHGKKLSSTERRPWKDVAQELAGDPFGAGDKIAAAGKACLFDASGAGFVTSDAARVARDPQRRKVVAAGKPVRRDKSANRWQVRWSDDRTPAQAIVDKLLADPDLAREVYKKLDAANSRRKYEKKRRSVA